MVKVRDGQWKHKGYDIHKRDGWYVAGWNTMIRPFLSMTLDGMRQLINKSIK